MNASVKQLPRLKKKSSQPLQLHKHKLGRAGEERAAAFLIQHGFEVIDHNIRLGRGEIDLVCFDLPAQELVFVEVKTRRSEYSGDPSTAIDHRKLRALLRTARAYQRTVWRKETLFRLDVVTVLPGKVTHYRNISWEMIK